ncbi:hypothetical protein [Actinoplanes sp. NPDC051411]|uniref:hypothetical protein n=1 Tax=Actinoplanes sp. NPDC051411 TaxID=3155522 RepID=UPI003435C8B3
MPKAVEESPGSRQVFRNLDRREARFSIVRSHGLPYYHALNKQLLSTRWRGGDFILEKRAGKFNAILETIRSQTDLMTLKSL